MSILKIKIFKINYLLRFKKNLQNNSKLRKMKLFRHSIISTSCLLNFLSTLSEAQTCASLNSCSGHGTCNPSTDVCSCFEGWGAASDIAYYKSPDCSLRTCPVDKSWGDIPTSPTEAHGLAEWYAYITYLCFKLEI